LQRFSPFLPLLFLVVLGFLAFVIWPEMDLALSRLFTQEGQGFVLRDNLFLNGLEKTAFYGARELALLLLVGVFYLFVRKRLAASKRWFFLLLCLLIGPGLFANLVFKNHWGRARPREIVAFGGEKEFTPAFFMSNSCDQNCSFVSGDSTFGFFLTSFAYVVTPRRRKFFFWSGFGAGCLFGGARLLLGAHFVSDILGGAVLALATSAALYALFFGVRRTSIFWRQRLGLRSLVAPQ